MELVCWWLTVAGDQQDSWRIFCVPTPDTKALHCNSSPSNMYLKIIKSNSLVQFIRFVGEDDCSHLVKINVHSPTTVASPFFKLG